MNGQEVFTRAIEFNSPPYIPGNVGANLDFIYEKDEGKHSRIRELEVRYPDDMIGFINAARNKTDPTEKDGVRTWTDEWDTGWTDDGHGGKTVSYPLEEGYDQLEGYEFPDPFLKDRFLEADKRLEGRDDRYVQSVVWFTLFERLWMLRGYENMLLDPYMYESDFCRLRDRITEYNLEMIDQWLKRDVNAVFFSDDWGSQKGLLMNPDDWRRFYKPSYKKMFDRVRSGGAHVWMHLCGNIISILPDLIDIGLNVLNPVQPQAMDVKELSREFGGKVCFFGGLDVQGTMIRGTSEDIKREIHELVDLFGRFNGGYICGTSHTVMPETPLDNIITMLETFLEYK